MGGVPPTSVISPLAQAGHGGPACAERGLRHSCWKALAAGSLDDLAVGRAELLL